MNRYKIVKFVPEFTSVSLLAFLVSIFGVFVNLVGVSNEVSNQKDIAVATVALNDLCIMIPRDNRIIIRCDGKDDIIMKSYIYVSTNNAEAIASSGDVIELGLVE